MEQLSSALTITRSALDKARLWSPELARVPDDEAREGLLTSIRQTARRPIATLDFHTGEPQSLVWLGPVHAPWGVALIKASTVVTVLDDHGAKYVAGRGAAKEAASSPPSSRLAELEAAVASIERITTHELAESSPQLNELHRRLADVARRARKYRAA